MTRLIRFLLLLPFLFALWLFLHLVGQHPDWEDIW